MKTKQHKALSPLVESFILRAQAEARVTCFRLTIRKQYDDQETQSQTWKEITAVFHQFIHDLPLFNLYCAFIALNVFTINNSRKADSQGKAALFVGRPYIDICLVLKDNPISVEQIEDILENLHKSCSLEINIQNFLPEDPVKGRKTISKWFVTCYKKSQETTTSNFLKYFTHLHTGNMLIAHHTVIDLCNTLAENFSVHGLNLTVFDLDNLPTSFARPTKQPVDNTDDAIML